MLRFISCFLLLASTAQAQVLVISKSGYYLLETAADGTPKLTPHAGFKQVIILDQPGPAPGPGPTPPPVLNTRATALRDASLKATADRARDRTALMLSVLYAEIAKKARNGEVKGADNLAVLARTGADMVLAKSAQESIPPQTQAAVEAAWKPMRDLLAAEWTALAQIAATDAGYAQLLEDAGAGLAASVPRAQAEAIDLQQLLAIIKLILDLITQLFPKGLPPGFPR